MALRARSRMVGRRTIAKTRVLQARDFVESAPFRRLSFQGFRGENGAVLVRTRAQHLAPIRPRSLSRPRAEEMNRFPFSATVDACDIFPTISGKRLRLPFRSWTCLRF